MASLAVYVGSTQNPWKTLLFYENFFYHCIVVARCLENSFCRFIFFGVKAWFPLLTVTYCLVCTRARRWNKRSMMQVNSLSETVDFRLLFDSVPSRLRI